MDVVLALNTSDTSTRGALTDRNHRLLRRFELETDVTDYDRWLHEIVPAARDLIGTDRLKAVGIGVAGNVEDGVIVDSGNLRDFNGRDIASHLTDAFNTVAAVLNDAQAEGLGEYKAYRIPLILLKWGRGVGVAIVTKQQDGTPLSRPTELGHMTIIRDSPIQCGCGGYGHLEALMGGAHLTRRFAIDHLSQLSDRQWRQVLTDVATGCVNLALGNKGMPIVISGNIGYEQLSPAPGRNRLPELQQLVNARKTTVRPPKLRIARHGEDSALIGASYAAWLAVS